MPQHKITFWRVVVMDGVWLQGALHGEMGRENFPVELSTFQTFGLTALQQQVYALSLSFVCCFKCFWRVVIAF